VPLGSGEVVTVEVEGLDQLERALEEMPGKLAKKSIRRALFAGATIFKQTILRLAPRKTGFMADHFGIKIQKTRGDDLAATAYIGPQGKIDYPDTDGGYRTKVLKNGKIKKVGRIAVASVVRFLTFGWSKKPAGDPFFINSFDIAKEQVLEETTKILAEEIENIAKESRW
jgi:hypothetical protein